MYYIQLDTLNGRHNCNWLREKNREREIGTASVAVCCWFYHEKFVQWGENALQYKALCFLFCLFSIGFIVNLSCAMN